MTASEVSKKGPVPGKLVRDLFFTDCDGEINMWMCKCKVHRKQSGTSSAKLVSHAESEHPDDFKKMANEEGYAYSTIASLSRHSRSSTRRKP